MTHGPQPNSVSALSDSDDVAEQKRGDVAGNQFGRLISLQLTALTVAVLMLTFVPPLREWVEESENDVCMLSTKVMTCLDWGLNAMLFLILLPVTLLTVHVTQPAFRRCLWVVWSTVLVLDVALFLTSFSWRNHAAATCSIMVAFVIVLAGLFHLPREMFPFTLSHSYSWAVKVGLVGGILLVVTTRDASYAWDALVAPACTAFVLYCCQMILDVCPPEHVMLGSMFVLFPEGLPLALWILNRRIGTPARQPLLDEQNNYGRSA
mmetsp:Transcript_87120/g.244422  ORF Transcript_87120/g.244422 Transcript_87120/m.244422 type:complete len:264 (+) Transcript_87120:92-883(+)